MSRRAMLFLIVFLLCPPLSHATEYTISIPELEGAIHQLVNVERKKHGLNALEFDEKLADIARKHSADMAKRNVTI